MSNSQLSTTRKAPSALRMVATSVAAVVLLGASFSAARGGSLAGYGPGPRGGDDDDGLSGGAIAGIALGGAAAVYFVAGAIEKGNEEEGATSSRASASRKVESVRVSPQHVRLERGAAQDFQVQVRYAGEKTWQNVTGNSEAALKVVDSTGRIVAVNGAKNVFTAPLDAKGGPATAQVVASYAGAQASTTVAVQ